MEKYYAVKRGKNPGVYKTWAECQTEVNGFSGAVYKSFTTYEDAVDFIKEKKGVQTDCELLAYVDGSFNSTKNEYGYGCVILENNMIKEKLLGKGNKPEYVSMRNVSGELMGSLVAMKYAIENGYKSIAIYYDYEGVEKWATKEWKTNKEGTKKYVEFVEKYQKHLTIHFVKVLAHSGDIYNDMADALAKQSIGIT